MFFVFFIGCVSDCDFVLGDLQFFDLYMYLFVSEMEVVVCYFGEGFEFCVNGVFCEFVVFGCGVILVIGIFEFKIYIILFNWKLSIGL